MGPGTPAPPEDRRLTTLDTSAIVALLDREDANHARVVAGFEAERAPHVVPAMILAEVAYFIERDQGFNVLAAFLLDLEGGSFVLDYGGEDLVRIVELARRYNDLPLGFSDAAVIACAERRGGRVLTLDRRHFAVVAREVDLEILP